MLSRIAGLFSGRGFNIETPRWRLRSTRQISQMTIVTAGDDQIIEQITKQLNKLIDVIKVTDLTEKEFVEREMVIVKVSPPTDQRAEVLRTCEIFRGRVVDSSPKTYTVPGYGRRQEDRRVHRDPAAARDQGDRPHWQGRDRKGMKTGEWVNG